MESDRIQQLLERNNELVEKNRVLQRQVDGWSGLIGGVLESRMERWVRSRIGSDAMTRRERAMQVLEEAVELAQSEGVLDLAAYDLLVHVYGRPKGEASQEAGAVAVCLLGWCAAAGESLIGLALQELERIENKDPEEIRGSLARKAKAGPITGGLCGE